MTYRLELTSDPTKVLTHEIRGNKNFIFQLAGERSEHPCGILFDEDLLISIADLTHFIPQLTLDISAKFWCDRGVLVGTTQQDFNARKKLFNNTPMKETPCYRLWWVLDDIEMQANKLNDRSFFDEARDYTERKIIECVLAQQKEAVK